MAVINGEQGTAVVGSASAPFVSILTGEAAEGGDDGGTGITYRMRGYDSTLAAVVYWNSTMIDSLGVSYLGPGPLTMIVVSNIIPHA